MASAASLLGSVAMAADLARRTGRAHVVYGTAHGFVVRPDGAPAPRDAQVLRRVSGAR